MGDKNEIMLEECEKALSTAASYFLQLGDTEIARLLAQATLVFYEEAVQVYIPEYDKYDWDTVYGYTLKVPPLLHKKLYSKDDTIKLLLDTVFKDFGIKPIGYKLQTIDYDVNWRIQLTAEAETQNVTNHSNFVGKTGEVYLGMKFNSPPEVAIAKALEAAGIMYLPNALARIGSKENRQTRFPDFLIQH